MSCKKNEPVAPVYGGCPVDPAFDRYMKKCLRKYPELYRMIDYIVDCKIAALRAEMCHMWMCRPSCPSMMYPGAMGSMPYANTLPVAQMQPMSGYPSM
jgi:hypothetical protein